MTRKRRALIVSCIAAVALVSLVTVALRNSWKSVGSHEREDCIWA